MVIIRQQNQMKTDSDRIKANAKRMKTDMSQENRLGIILCYHSHTIGETHLFSPR